MYKLCVSLLITLLAIGCGGDDDAASGPPDGGADQCIGAADQAILASFIADGGVGQSPELNDILRTCAQGSCSAPIVERQYDEATDCMATCFESTDLAGLSEPCTFCWTAGIICTGRNCVAVCLGDNPELCEACVLENCVPARSYCTGL